MTRTIKRKNANELNKITIVKNKSVLMNIKKQKNSTIDMKNAAIKQLKKDDNIKLEGMMLENYL